MTRGPRRAPAERATIDGMEHVRTGVQRRTLIGAGIAVLAFGGVIGAFAATDDDDSGPRQEISDTAETTTTSTTSTTVVAQDATVAPVAPPEPVEPVAAPTAAPTSSTTLPPAPEAVTEEQVEPVAAQRTTAEPPPTTSTIAICADGEPMRQYGCP